MALGAGSSEGHHCPQPHLSGLFSNRQWFPVSMSTSHSCIHSFIRSFTHSERHG